MEQKIKKAIRTEKPWGYELLWADTDKFIAKILVIKKDHRLSLQYHKVKSEIMTLSRGKVVLELNGQSIPMLLGYSYHIEPEVEHRLMAFEDSEIIEVSTPQKDDTIRLKDDYGRE